MEYNMVLERSRPVFKKNFFGYSMCAYHNRGSFSGYLAVFDRHVMYSGVKHITDLKIKYRSV